MEQQIEIQKLALHTYLERARSLAVMDDDSCKEAGEELVVIKAVRNRLDAYFGPAVRKAYEAHKEIVALRNHAERPLDEAEVILKRNIGAYELEQRRIAAEDERKERERLEREAEIEREAELEQAESEGASAAEIAEIVTRPLPVPVMVTPVRQPVRTAGVSMRENWKAVVDDKAKLVRYCTTNPEYLNLLDPNMAAINNIVRSLKSATKIPGVRVYNEPIIAARR